MTDDAAFLQALLRSGLLIASGVDGLYGGSGAFDDLIDAIGRLISRWGAPDGAEVMRFPPGMNRAHFERSGYLDSFPHLAGTVHSFRGDEAAHAALLDHLHGGEDWTAGQTATRLVLAPAACYPVYPAVAAGGPMPGAGRLIDVCSYCFRHEPSSEPTRLQMFRMREFVRLGTPDQVLGFRQSWLDRGRRMIEGLELPVIIDLANDPFFGRGGRMLAASQRDQGLKFELSVPITRADRPTACLSFNYHQEHFGQGCGLRTADDRVAHTACVGFGLERIALALLHRHGLDPEAWPRAVRRELWGDAG